MDVSSNSAQWWRERRTWRKKERKKEKLHQHCVISLLVPRSSWSREIAAVSACSSSLHSPRGTQLHFIIPLFYFFSLLFFQLHLLLPLFHHFSLMHALPFLLTPCPLPPTFSLFLYILGVFSFTTSTPFPFLSSLSFLTPPIYSPFLPTPIISPDILLTKSSYTHTHFSFPGSF